MFGLGCVQLPAPEEYISQLVTFETSHPEMS